ncbi:hypothetical protein H6P81_016232 [Aristolochia fimbriata]|uniref:Uncharacterized protein n=1 Tax=Aristolochia fimbriata TaxID=158543 RepID=A0AAV7E7R8_ARIFI|nr:hypothetical protein H6P81_016232 [Aristolochia fimbriata]
MARHVSKPRLAERGLRDGVRVDSNSGESTSQDRLDLAISTRLNSAISTRLASAISTCRDSLGLNRLRSIKSNLCDANEERQKARIAYAAYAFPVGFHSSWLSMWKHDAPRVFSVVQSPRYRVNNKSTIIQDSEVLPSRRKT